jgi:regulator of protease activity HflC (stomatin/prohibitin superfamily)
MIEPKKVPPEHVKAIQERMNARNKARRLAQRAELDLEDVVEAALAAAGASPGWSINLEKGEATPPDAAPAK